MLTVGLLNLALALRLKHMGGKARKFLLYSSILVVAIALVALGATIEEHFGSHLNH